MTAVSPDQVLKVLAVTDSFNLHREAIFIPLATETSGSVAILSDGRLRITCPSAEAFEHWLTDLKSQLLKMDLSKVRK